MSLARTEISRSVKFHFDFPQTRHRDFRDRLDPESFQLLFVFRLITDLWQPSLYNDLIFTPSVFIDTAAAYMRKYEGIREI